ncbi:thioredoxin family protein [Loigolactobacillus iwatensis]|uniref:thioredoxin family protein n=1 Tax=Loigolactobacillus iwatensis TaxID=1267156 RepID=UPI000F7EFC8A|nr:thioredoxin domain-containing protein [Loigolactobacillus iwatensis]
MAKNITDKSFVTATAAGFILVDFCAAWCAPCQKMTPILLACEQNISALKVVRLNVDQNPQSTKACGVQGLPTLMIFWQGRPYQRVTGYQPQAVLLPHLQQLERECFEKRPKLNN